MGFLQDIWGTGQGLMDQGQGVTQLRQQSNQLYGQGQQMLGGLANNPFLTGNLSAGGQQQLQGMNQNIETMGGRAMHQLGQTGVQAGAFGQGRGAVGRGVIGEGMMMASNDAYSQAMQGDLARGGIFTQGQIGGLQGLGGVQAAGAQGAMAPWMPAQMQSALVGSPAIVGDASSNAWNMSTSAGVGGK